MGYKSRVLPVVLSFSIIQETSTRWSKLWTPVSEDGLCGWVNTIEEAEAVRKAYEVEKSLTFVSGKKEARFGKSDLCKYMYILEDRSSKIRFFTGDVLFWWT